MHRPTSSRVRFTADPELTALGESQARSAHNAWESELASKIPLPEKLYCSPLTRALRTAKMTFDGILTDENRKTMIVEVRARILMTL